MATVPRWGVVAAWIAFLAALPTVLWRVVLGMGFDLGTPDAWRAEQVIPGAGTAYVLGLAALQLLAALAVVRMVRPGGDRVPRWSPILAGRRVPTALVCGIALTGAAILVALCAMSIHHWSNVDPFAGEPDSAWNSVCTGCYLAVLLWPPALVIAVIGYAISRRRDRHQDVVA
ncbi:hypothetical protein [Nocardia cyriacigeorgica]|uniref:hypothetical protein n=1 Tax=Nocardia cyriacigeorgica TaxID=135487 RepID=UPI00245904B9|nr:hypothetical protein [Nocardia cyriacigeorgica]